MSDSCIKAAKEAAAKVNAMLLASGQWKPSEINKAAAKPEKPANLFVEEVFINDAPMSARNYLTRSSTQDEISKMSGASVSTRGRYMSQAEAEKCTSSSLDKPLHLHIQGVNEQDVKVAVGRIMHLIMEHTHRKSQPHPRHARGHRGASASVNHSERSPSKGVVKGPGENFGPKATPPLSAPQNVLREKVFLPMNVGLDPVEVRMRLLGEDGANLKYIEDETGISVLLCGIGSGMLDPKTQQEIPEPLHFYIEHPNAEQFNQAKDFVVNLAQTILSQLQQEQQQQQQHIQAHPQPPPPAAPSQPHVAQDLVTPSRPPTVAPQMFSQPGLPPPPAPHLAATAATVNGSNIIQPQPGIQAQIATPFAPQIVLPPPTTSQLPPSSLAPPLSIPQPGIQVSSYQPPQSNPAVVITSHPVVNHTINAPQVAEGAPTPAPSTQVLQISVPGPVNGSQVVSQQLVQTSSGPQLVQIPHGTQIVSTPEGPRLVTFAAASASIPATFPVQPALPGATAEIQAPAAASAPQQSVSALAPQPLQYIPANTYSAEAESARFNSGTAVFSTAPPPAQTTSITYFQPSAGPPPDSSAALLPPTSQPAVAVPPPSFVPPLSVQHGGLQAAAEAQVGFAQVPISHPDTYQVPIGPATTISSVGTFTCTTTTTLSQPAVTYQDSGQQLVPDWRSFPAPRTDIPVQNFTEPQPDPSYLSKPNETVISVATKDSLLPWAQYTQSSEEVDEPSLRTQASDQKTHSLYALPPRLQQRAEGAGGAATGPRVAPPPPPSTAQEREVTYQPTIPSPYTPEVNSPQGYWQAHKRSCSPAPIGVCPDAKATRSLIYKDDLLDSAVSAKEPGAPLPYLIEKSAEKGHAHPELQRTPYSTSYPPSMMEGPVAPTPTPSGIGGSLANKGGALGEILPSDGSIVDPQWKWPPAGESNPPAPGGGFPHPTSGPSTSVFPPPYFERPPGFGAAPPISGPPPYQGGPGFSPPPRCFEGSPRTQRPRRFFHNSPNRWRKNPKFRKP